MKREKSSRGCLEYNAWTTFLTSRLHHLFAYYIRFQIMFFFRCVFSFFFSYFTFWWTEESKLRRTVPIWSSVLFSQEVTFYFATSKAYVCIVHTTSHTILIWNPLILPRRWRRRAGCFTFFSMIFVVFFYFQCFMRTRSNIWKCDYEIVLFFKAQGYRRRLEPKIYLNFIQTTTRVYWNCSC